MERKLITTGEKQLNWRETKVLVSGGASSEAEFQRKKYKQKSTVFPEHQ